MQNKILLYIIFLFILVSGIKAATIHGDVYDFELNKLSDVIVEIDTTPKQSTIIKDQGYSFNVPSGNYTISADYIVKGEVQASTKENILIKDDKGDYTLDLILFPSLNGNDLFNASDIDVTLTKERSNTLYLYIAVLIILGVALFFILKALRHKNLPVPEDHSLIELPKKTQAPQEDEDLNKVLEIIKKNQGRITQKDIRKQLNLSEAKISLVITQLEAEKKIKKIKKGRGNVIILNK